MRKVLIAIISLSACTICAFAQTEQVATEKSSEKVVSSVSSSKNVLVNDFKYNWELYGGLGTQFFYGDNDKYYSFFERFTFPAVDLLLTKWASPVIGCTFGLHAFALDGLYQKVNGVDDEINARFQTDNFIKHSSMTRNSLPIDYYQQKGFCWNPFVAAMFNLSNLFGGFEPDRFYSMQVYFGGGVVFAKDEPVNAHGVSFNTGLINKFRLNEKMDIVLNLRGGLISDEFDGESRFNEPTVKQIKKNVPWDGMAGVTAGLCYRFGSKKNLNSWRTAEVSTVEYHHYTPVTVPGPERIIRDTLEVSRPVDPSLWFHIQFKIDKTDIQPRERININSIADFIKSCPDTKFIVCGFADKQTSYPEHNLWLSEHRAKNVYDMLVNRFGVNPDQLVVDYKGGVDYMFYTDNELSRCVMIVPLNNDKGIEDYGEREMNKK